ncbi:MAG: type II secretion system protein [Nitriliruptorales bacterium]|nr:type II secretion system protein [Nitriliruptorales bacterium]
MTRAKAKSSQDGATLVEMLVVIVILGAVSTAVFGLFYSSNRAYHFTSDVREVMDDGRVSLERIRRELRAGRRVFDDSNAQRMHFWVDQDQDSAQEPWEEICYVVRSISGEADRWHLVRWTVGVPDSSRSEVPCDQAPPADGRTIAATLRDTAVFSYDCNGVTPCPPTDPTSTDVVREVTINFLLDVRTDAGPDTLAVSATVRLRNVA